MLTIQGSNISHHWERKIIIKHCHLRGYVSETRSVVMSSASMSKAWPFCPTKWSEHRGVNWALTSWGWCLHMIELGQKIGPRRSNIHRHFVGSVTIFMMVATQILFIFSPRTFGEDERNLKVAHVSDGLVNNHQPDLFVEVWGKCTLEYHPQKWWPKVSILVPMFCSMFLWFPAGSPYTFTNFPNTQTP